jgi:hypothetical protein
LIYNENSFAADRGEVACNGRLAMIALGMVIVLADRLNKADEQESACNKRQANRQPKHRSHPG